MEIFFSKFAGKDWPVSQICIKMDSALFGLGLLKRDMVNLYIKTKEALNLQIMRQEMPIEWPYL